LLIDGLAAPLELLNRSEGTLDLFGLEDLQNALAHGLVDQVR
jgi:hypothetical protein